MKSRFKTVSRMYRPSTSHSPVSVVRRSKMLEDYYGDERVRRQRRVKRMVIIIAAAFLIQSFFQIPFFRIRDVEVQGLKFVDESAVRSVIDQELARRRWLLFTNDNVWLFSSKNLRQRLDEELRLDVIELDRRPPHTLTIAVRERVSGFVHQTPDGYELLDIHGQSVGPVDKPGPGQVVIADERSTVNSAIPLNYLETATSIVEEWNKAVVPLGLEKFHLNDDAGIAIVSTTKGWRVYFHPDRDISLQIARLSLFLQDTNLETPREYLDLRFDDSLYSK